MLRSYHTPCKKERHCGLPFRFLLAKQHHLCYIVSKENKKEIIKMKSRKPMRGIYWWILLCLCAGLFVKTIIDIVREGFGSVMNSDKAWGLIAPVLYFAAWFIVPKLKFLQPVDRSAPKAEENAPLAVPARLTIVRDSSVVAAVLPTDITLNGVPACSVKNGASETIKLTMKHNVLLTNATGSPNVRFEFDAPDGGNGELHVKANAFRPKTLIWK